MSGVNKVILVGRLGKDPEVKFLPSGGAVANVSIATSEKWNDKNTGQPVEKTEWHRVVIFGKLAEVVRQYVFKGSQIYVEGKLETRKWQDQSGQDRYTTEIKAHSMQMLDSKQGGSDQRGQSAQSPQQPQQAPNVYQQQPQQAPQQQQGFASDTAPDDDIPFN